MNVVNTKTEAYLGRGLSSTGKVGSILCNKSDMWKRGVAENIRPNRQN